MLALKKVVDEPESLGKKYKWLWLSTALTAGVAFLFAIAPSMLGSVISSSEMASIQQIPDDYTRGALISSLTQMREAMFSADAWRTVFIILLGVALVFAYLKKWLKAEYMTAALIVLCLIDMWQVNKRYLNNDMFVEPTVRETAQEMTPADEEILKDKSDCGNYRVLNMASNTFNENETSYYHKSIGGYHAAKLQRYQEMIDHYIAPEMGALSNNAAVSGNNLVLESPDSIIPMLNMLNMRYLIAPSQQGTMVLKNPYAMGNAWFVNKVDFVENANQEIDGIAQTDLRTAAVADKKFAAELQCAANDSVNGKAQITSYAPNHLTYDVETDKQSVLVFSEVYYPGWTATIDGKDVPVGRVNYILRAIVVPQGKHKVELMFYPTSVDTTETIAYIGYALLLLILIAVIIKAVRKK